MTRGLIRRQLVAAWQTTIDERYQRRLVNSERGLQVHFCSALLAQFKQHEVDRLVFVEPRVSLGADGDVRYPDLVVCNRRSVIAVIELKFVPRGRPDSRKDLETLGHFASGSEIEVASERYLGDSREDPKRTVAKDAVLVWGGIYTGDRLAFNDAPGSHDGRFLQLDALTADGRAPTVHPNAANSRPGRRLRDASERASS